MRRLRLSLIFAFATACHSVSAASSHLFLIGGSAIPCQQTSTALCSDNSLAGQRLYSLSKTKINGFLASREVKQAPPEQQKWLGKVLNNINTAMAKQVFKQADLYQLMASPPFQGIPNWLELSNPPLRQSLLNHLEVAQDAEFQALTATQLKPYQAFLQQAATLGQKNTAIKIGIVTALHSDSFAAVVPYQTLLQRAAKTMTPTLKVEIEWLAIDRHWQTARHYLAIDANACQKLQSIRNQDGVYRRDKLYPTLSALQQQQCQSKALLTQQIQQLQGLLFSDGQLGNGLAALPANTSTNANDWPQHVKQQYQAGKLVLAGVGAGATLLTGSQTPETVIPLVHQGTASTAVKKGLYPYGGLIEAPEDALVYSSNSGLNLFPLASVDTHFTQGQHATRLAVLSAATNTPWSFGIDLHTGLHIQTQQEQWQMTITGDGGVMIFDTRGGIYKRQGQKQQIVAMSHRLHRGDHITYTPDTGLVIELEPSAMKQEPSAMRQEPSVQSIAPATNLWQKHAQENCGQIGVARWSQDGIAYLLNSTDATEYQKQHDNQGAQRCSYTNLMFGIEN